MYKLITGLLARVPGLNSADDQNTAFVRLAWQENTRRGGYFSSWAIGKRLRLWCQAWKTDPETVPLPPANPYNPRFTEPLDDPA